MSDKILQVKLPKPQEADLPNGVHLMVLEDRRAPQVSFNLLIRGAGGYFDPADHVGVAQFTASMPPEGTTTRTSQQISEQLARMAASLSFGAGLSSEDTSVSAGALTEYVDQVLDLAADIVLNPAFPDAQLARYKARTRAALMQQRAQPTPPPGAGALLGRTGRRPSVRPRGTSARIAGKDDTGHARRVPQRALRARPRHHRDGRRYLACRRNEEGPGRLRILEEGGRGGPVAAAPAAFTVPGVYLVSRPNSVQTNLLVGVQAIKRTDPDYCQLIVLNKVIGGGPTGRLFRHLREKKGYTYGAYSNVSAPAYRGIWIANTEVRTEVTEAALTDLIDELRQVREVPVPVKEFNDATRSLVAAFALELDNPMSATAMPSRLG